MTFRYLWAGAAAIAVSLAGSPRLEAQDTGGGIYVPFDFSGVSGDLAVEVDGIDMTAFVELAEGGILIRPEFPLDPGTYEVVLYLWQGDDYQVLAVETHTVDGGGDGGSEFTVTATHEAGARSLNGDETDEFARSSGEVEIRTVDNRLNARAAWLATTEDDEELAGRPVDLGEYFIEFNQQGEQVDLSLRLGNQALSYDRALVADITRRGVSALVTTTDQRFEFGAFAIQSSESLGIKNALGVEHENDRFHGGMLAWRPSDQIDLQFGVTGYNGRGDPYDTAITGEGSGYSAFIRGSFADGRARYELDFAETEWDEDAELAGFSPVQAGALLAGLEYDVLNGDDGDGLTFGIAYEWVEAGFFSLANPGLAAGREDIRLTADFFNDRWSWSGMIEHQETNTAGPPTLETDRIVTAQLDGSYLPYPEGGGPAWVGEPEIIFGTNIQVQDRLETPAMAPDPMDFTSVEFYGGLVVQHNDWGWSATYTYADYDDETPINEDEVSHRLDASLDWARNDKLSFSASGALTHFDGFDGTYVDKELGLSVTYDFVPGEWSASGDLSWYDYGAPGAIDGAVLSGDLTWTFADETDMVFSAGIAQGSSAVESSEDPEWFVGLMLRRQTNVFSGGS